MKISDLHIDMSDEIEALLEDAPTTGAGDVAGIDKKFNKKKTKKTDDDDDCEETDMVKRKPSLKEALDALHEGATIKDILKYFGVTDTRKLHTSDKWDDFIKDTSLGKPNSYGTRKGEVTIIYPKGMVAYTLIKGEMTGITSMWLTKI